MDIKQNGEVYSWKSQEFREYKTLNDFATFTIADGMWICSLLFNIDYQFLIVYIGRISQLIAKQNPI